MRQSRGVNTSRGAFRSSPIRQNPPMDVPPLRAPEGIAGGLSSYAHRGLVPLFHLSQR